MPRRSARSSPSRPAGSIMSRGSPRSPPTPMSSPTYAGLALAAARRRRSAAPRSILLLVGALTVDQHGRRPPRRSARSTLLTLLKALPLIALALWGLARPPALCPPPGPAAAALGARGGGAAHPLCLRRLRECARAGRRDRRPAPHHPARADRHRDRHRRALFPVQLAYVAVMPAGAGARRAARRLRRGADRPGRRAAADRHRAGLGRRQCRQHDDLDAARHLRARRAGLAAALVRRGQRALGDAGQFDAVHGRWSVAALALTGSFVWLAIVSTLARLVVYVVSIAALPKRGAAGRRRPGR